MEWFKMSQIIMVMPPPPHHKLWLGLVPTGLLAVTLAGKTQAGGNAGLKERETGFPPHRCPQERKLPSTALESDDAIRYLLEQAKCQGV